MNFLFVSLCLATVCCGKVTVFPVAKVQQMVQDSGLGYNVTKFLGRGGFGQVFLALDPCGTKYAIKIFQNITAPDFQRELYFHSLLRNVSVTENIVQLCQHQQNVSISNTLKCNMIVYEYLPYTMNSYLRHLNSTQPPNLDLYHKAIFYKILKGLSDLHRHNVVHKDLKRGNILIDDSLVSTQTTDRRLLARELMHHLSVKIGDFGASLHSPSSTFAKSSVLTSEYAAPEYFVNLKNASTSFDLWSFGMMLIEHYMKPKYPQFFVRKYSKHNLFFINKHMGALSDLTACVDLAPFKRAKARFKAMEARNDTECVVSHYLEKYHYALERMDETVKPLVHGLLQVDDRKRISAQCAMDHPFFREFRPQESWKWESFVLTGVLTAALARKVLGSTKWRLA